MSTKFDSAKALKTLIKFSTVALTSPATVVVASSLYPTDPVLRTIVSIAALILVEGCLLLGWQMLDQNGKNATMAQRWLYAGLAWNAYFSLSVIALSHNEGLAGLTFRLTLGVVLLSTSVEAGLLAGIRRESQAYRDIMSDWAVRRHKPNRERELAKVRIDHEFANAKADLETESIIVGQRRSLDKERRIEAVSAEHRIQMARLPHTQEPERFPYPIQTARRRRVRQQHVSREETLNRIVDIVRDNPDLSLRQLGERVGIGHETARRYLETLEGQRLIRRNGNITLAE